MEIITKFLEIVQVAQWFVLGVFLVAAAGLVVIGLARRDRRLLLVGVAAAIAPFALPALLNLGQKNSRADRRAVVAAMPREPLPVAYPRQMVVRGFFINLDVGRMMAMTDLDQVVVENDGSVAWHSIANRSQACQVVAHAISRVPNRYAHFADGWNRVRGDYVHCKPTVGKRFALAPTYLLVRLDANVTRRVKDRKPAPAAVQIDLVRGGHEHLIHYDELPVLNRPSSTTRLLPDSPKYPCTGFDTAQVVANVLDSARDRAGAAGIMRSLGQPDRCTFYRPPT